MHKMNYLNQKILSCSLISQKYHVYPNVRWEFFWYLIWGYLIVVHKVKHIL